MAAKRMHAISDEAVLRRARAFCLALPETREQSSWGHPNFRAGKRTFVTFEWIKGNPSLAIRLGRNGVRQYAKARGTFLTPYGRGEWLSFKVDGQLNWRLMQTLIVEGYRAVALKRMLTALDGPDRAPAYQRLERP
jgi:predicted DNA-binding protein (MmcQ/YjbR family)